MREDISFEAEGATLRGWFYAPEPAGGNGGHPCVGMAHGSSAVKEQHLPFINFSGPPRLLRTS